MPYGLKDLDPVMSEATLDYHFEHLAKGYAKLKDVAGANSTLNGIKDGERRSLAAYQVALILARGGLFQEARATAKHRIHVLNIRDDMSRSRRTEQRLEDALAEIDEIERTYGSEKPESPKPTNKPASP